MQNLILSFTMGKKETLLEDLKEKIKNFVRERDWEKYHSPKNLSMAIAIEAAELMEHFQWISEKESEKLLKNPEKRQEIEEELADIAIYILDFCNLFDIDFEKIVEKKLKKSAEKYPVNLVKGKSHKYTHYKKSF